MKVVGSLILKHFVDNSANDKSSFYRLTVSSEVGYDCRFSKFTAFDKAIFKQLESISVGDDVIVTGYESLNGFFTAKQIEVTDTLSESTCPCCFRPRDMSQDAQVVCDGCCNDVKERISGTWTVVSTKRGSTDGKSMKLVLIQEENALGYVAFDKAPFFDILSNLAKNEQVNLQGWRDDQRKTKLSYVRKM